VITAYAITFGGFLLLGGRIADLFGRASLPRRRCGLHGRVVRLWSRLDRVGPDRVARSSGPWRRDHLTGGALDRDPFIPVSIAALAGIEPHEAGLASGLINTAQQIGVAVTSSISISHFNHETATGVAFPAAFTSGSQRAFRVMVGISVLGFLGTLVLVRRDELATVGEIAAAPA